MTVTGRVRCERVGGIVLAGSYEWSGSLFERVRVRPLLPVALKPIIDHVLNWLDGAEVPETIICANGSTSALRSHLEATYHSSSLAIGYHEDRAPRGAAGCVKDAARQSQADTLIVTDGASIPTVDVPRLIAAHRESGAELTIVAHQRLSAYSAVPQFHPTGTYVFDRHVLDAVPPTTFQDIKENLIPKMYREGRAVELFVVDDVSPRVLDADTYLALNRWLLDRLTADGRPNEGVMHPKAWIDHDAVVIGPVVIGEGVRVHAGATIVGPTVIGSGTVVRRGATVARSVTWDDCEIGERAFVDQSVLVEGASVEAEETVSRLLRAETPGRRHLPALHSNRSATTSPPALARPALS